MALEVRMQRADLKPDSSKRDILKDQLKYHKASWRSILHTLPNERLLEAVVGKTKYSTDYIYRRSANLGCNEPPGKHFTLATAALKDQPRAMVDSSMRGKLYTAFAYSLSMDKVYYSLSMDKVAERMYTTKYLN